MGKHRKDARDGQLDVIELLQVLHVSPQDAGVVRDLAPAGWSARQDERDSFGPTTLYGTAAR
jgi:hypothetical protein